MAEPREAAPFLCFYGDDFTGSTDALDALHRAGVASVLLTEPSLDLLGRFPGVAAIGLAGTSRTYSLAQMDARLPAVFRWMAATGARALHYKVCSTFDSSPTLGSIGRAIELAVSELGSGSVPVLVGSPALGRYVAFGNLFARAGAAPEIHRLDRHPVMSRHPVTPMDEADLALHLGRQTDLPIRKLTAPEIDAGSLPELHRNATEILVCDTVRPEHLDTLGDWLAAARPQLFCVGSSALETALAPRMPGATRSSPRLAGSGAPIAVVSGSCSPVTARQITSATQAGFAAFRLSPSNLVGTRFDAASVSAPAIDALVDGRSVILYSALGAADHPARDGAEALIGERLGEVLGLLIARVGLGRVAVAGGDTSGAVCQQLGIAALQVAAHVTPGAPLCIGHHHGGRTLEIALKGGQMGGNDYFQQVRDA